MPRRTTPPVPTLDVLRVRRLALERAGLLAVDRPPRVPREEAKAREAAHAVIRRFGYLQLDTVSIAGARSHALVLHSRLDGFDPELGERLLLPGEPLFEYWGHEVSWLPIEMYPLFHFRRVAFKSHPWWGDLLGRYPDLAKDLVRRIQNEGPLRSSDFEGEGSKGWWALKPAKKVASALWSSGKLAIRERRRFQRVYDLTERVIPEAARTEKTPAGRAIPALLQKALEGHGWAETGTLAATWRLRNMREEVARGLARLVREKAIVASDLLLPEGGRRRGWIRPQDLDLAERLAGARIRNDRSVLLSPFDPVLWDRRRVTALFGFDQVLEIFKRGPDRKYGYYCLPVLAGEDLVARVDLKADRKAGTLRVLAEHLEVRRARAKDSSERALARYARALGFEVQR